MLGIPPTFEIQGALCIGRPKPTAPDMKAPRRPKGEVWSVNAFERPVRATYPAKPAAAYPFFKISNARNPFAEWRPQVWGWDRIADFRGYAVWAKSPIAGVYRSRRQGETTAAELSFLPKVGAGARVVDVMPWGGTHTTELAKALPGDVRLGVADLAVGNLVFTQERLRQEGVRQPVDALLMDGPKLPLPDNSVDTITLFQVLEHTPEPERLLDEVARVLKPGGSAVITVRNKFSLYGWNYFRCADARAGAEPGAVRAARGAQRARDGGGALCDRARGRHLARQGRRRQDRRRRPALRRTCHRDARLEDRDDRLSARAARRGPRPLFADRDAADILLGRTARGLPCGSCPNVEHYEYLPPAGPRDPWPRTPHPDVLGYGVRDYGNRVGLWRMFDVMDHFGIRGTSSLNLAVFDHYPQILEAHEKRKWDVMAHGLYNTRYHWNMAEDAERAAIEECVESYRRHTGRQLAGWFSPAATFTREHARPRGRGGHQILLRLVSRRSAVPDPHAQRQADHDPVPDGYQRRDDLSPFDRGARSSPRWSSTTSIACTRRRRIARW